jgi:hypothetical protein
MTEGVSLKIDRVDYQVITVHNLERTCEFYSGVFRMDVITFGKGCQALQFGQQKLLLPGA